jgi:hypothetical protein
MTLPNRRTVCLLVGLTGIWVAATNVVHRLKPRLGEGWAMHVLFMPEVLARARPAHAFRIDSASKNWPQRRKKRMTEAINSLHVTIQAGIYK